MKYWVSGIVFISMAIVLIHNPSQLFSRHDPVMVRLFNSNAAYIHFIKYFGYFLLLIGIAAIITGVSTLHSF